MNTQKRKFSWVNAGPYICAFFVPVLVMLVVFIERGIWPFGDRCFLCTDLYHQMAPFHKELQWKLVNGGSLLYSWNIGAGTNFWTLSAYYNASPWTFLVGLWPEAYVIEFITVSAVFKIGLSGLTMAYYLNKRQGRRGVEAYTGAFIGGFYALSGWMAAYSWVVMWLDCIWLFPLIILGLERLVRENKGLLYCVSLSATIFCNYYIGIISCMGIAVYCFFLLGTERRMYRAFGIKLLKFIFYTCLAVAGAAVILIPYIRYFNMTWSAESTFTWKWYSYFPVIDMLSRMLINVEVHKGLDHWPNIFMGMAVFMLIPLYYLNKKITLREKIGYTIVVLFFWFSFSTRAMDYLWHVFHIPHSLLCRQSFIFVFIMLTMAYRGLDGLKDRTYREIGIVMMLALGFVFLAEKVETNTEVFTNYVFYVSALFIIVYAIVFYGMRRGRIYKDVLIIILIAVCIIENVVNTSVTSIPTVGRNDYIEYDDGINAAMEIIREKEGEDSFYRVEKAQLRTKNDGAPDRLLHDDRPGIFRECLRFLRTDLPDQHDHVRQIHDRPERTARKRSVLPRLHQQQKGLGLREPLHASGRLSLLGSERDLLLAGLLFHASGESECARPERAGLLDALPGRDAPLHRRDDRQPDRGRVRFLLRLRSHLGSQEHPDLQPQYETEPELHESQPELHDGDRLVRRGRHSHLLEHRGELYEECRGNAVPHG